MATIRGGTKAGPKLAEMAKRLMSAKTVRVGFLENTKHYPGGLPVAAVAAIQEYGAPRAGIPPRPFFRTMIANHKAEWGPAIAELLRHNGGDAKGALAQTGEVIAGQLRESIVNVTAPPLSPVTIVLRRMFGNHPELIRKRDVWKAQSIVKSEETSVNYFTNKEGLQRAKLSGSLSGEVSAKPLMWTGLLYGSADYEVQ